MAALDGVVIGSQGWGLRHTPHRRQQPKRRRVALAAMRPPCRWQSIRICQLGVPVNVRRHPALGSKSRLYLRPIARSSHEQRDSGDSSAEGSGEELAPRPPVDYSQQLHRSQASCESVGSSGSGGSRLVSFLSAWDTLSARLPRSWSSSPGGQEETEPADVEDDAFPASRPGSPLLQAAPTSQQQRHTTELILNALKLSVSWLSSLSDDQQPAASGPATAPILVATQLADLASCGFPIDHEVIAAAIVAEAADLDSLDARTVEAKLGPSVLALLQDIQRVRTLPSRVELLDDEAASGLRELCLSFYDVRSIVVEVVRRHVALAASSDRLPAWARQVRALEALQIYAPLGHGLGLSALCSDMEDRCFQELFPRSYEETASWLRQETMANTDTLQRCSSALERGLAACPGISEMAGSVDIQWRTKSLFSTMRKLLAMDDFARGGRGRGELFDLLGLRVIVHPLPSLLETDPEEAERRAAAACHAVAAVAHELWPPVAGRYKDYITHPKPNGYQSVHTTVRVASVTVDVPSLSAPRGRAGGESAVGQQQQRRGRRAGEAEQQRGVQDGLQFDNGLGSGSGTAEGAAAMELQIRTAAMHAAAESGEAAHAAYKGGLDGRQAGQLRAWTGALQSTPALLCMLRDSTEGAQQGSGSVSSALDSWKQAAHDMFRHLDRDGDGHLSQAELQQLVEELGVDVAGGGAAAEAADVMRAVAARGDGSTSSSVGPSSPHSADISRVTFPQFLEFHRQVSVLRALPRVDEQTLKLLRGKEENMARSLAAADEAQRSKQQQQLPDTRRAGSSSSGGGDCSVLGGRGGAVPVSQGGPRLPVRSQQQQQRRVLVAAMSGRVGGGSRFARPALTCYAEPRQQRQATTTAAATTAPVCTAQLWQQQLQRQRTGLDLDRQVALEEEAGLYPTLASMDAEVEEMDNDTEATPSAYGSYDNRALLPPLGGANGGVVPGDVFELVARAPVSRSSSSSSSSASSGSSSSHGGSSSHGASDSHGASGSYGDGLIWRQPPQRLDEPAGDEAGEQQRQQEEASSAPLLPKPVNAHPVVITKLPPRPRTEPMTGLLRRMQRKVKRRINKLDLQLVPVEGNPYRLVDPDIPQDTAAKVAARRQRWDVGASDLKASTSGSDQRERRQTRGVAIPRLGPFVVGAVSDRDCDAQLDVPTVSGRHARIEVISNAERGKKCILTDLGSTNGTWINRSRVQPARDVELLPGDVVSFGEPGIAFRVVEVLVKHEGPADSALDLALRKVTGLLASTSSKQDSDHLQQDGVGMAAEYAYALEQAREFLRRGDWRDAVLLLERAVASDPGNGPLWGQLANTYRRTAKRSELPGTVRGYAPARVAYRACIEAYRAAERKADSPAELHEAQRGLVRCFRSWAKMEFDLGHHSSARRLFQLSLAVSHHHVPGLEAAGGVKTLFVLAHKEWRAGNRRQAQDAVNRALEASPTNVHSLALAGMLAADAGKHDEARVMFSRALETDPEHEVTLQAWGRLEAASHRAGKNPIGMDDARRLFDTALRLNPTNAYVLQAWAVAEAAAREPEAARGLFARAAAADPRSAYTWQAWGVMEAGQGDLEEARQLLGRALELGQGNNAAVLTAAGRVERLAGDDNAARELLEAAYSLSPKHLPTLYELVQLETTSQKGDPRRASLLLREVKRLDPRGARQLGGTVARRSAARGAGAGRRGKHGRHASNGAGRAAVVEQEEVSVKQSVNA